MSAGAELWGICCGRYGAELFDLRLSKRCRGRGSPTHRIPPDDGDSGSGQPGSDGHENYQSRERLGESEATAGRNGSVHDTCTRPSLLMSITIELCPFESMIRIGVAIPVLEN